MVFSFHCRLGLTVLSKVFVPVKITKRNLFSLSEVHERYRIGFLSQHVSQNLRAGTQKFGEEKKCRANYYVLK